MASVKVIIKCYWHFLSEITLAVCNLYVTFATLHYFLNILIFKYGITIYVTPSAYWLHVERKEKKILKDENDTFTQNDEKVFTLNWLNQVSIAIL